MPRDYKAEYRTYQGTPEQIRRRSSRNKARRKMLAQGRVKRGQDVDHRDSNPMNNSNENLRATSPSRNRSRNK